MKPTIKPRNPFVAPAKFRKAGTHEKPFKARRRDDKVALATPIRHGIKETTFQTEPLPKHPVTWVLGQRFGTSPKPSRKGVTHAIRNHRTISRNIANLFQQYRCGGVKRTIIPVS